MGAVVGHACRLQKQNCRSEQVHACARLTDQLDQDPDQHESRSDKLERARERTAGSEVRIELC